MYELFIVSNETNEIGPKLKMNVDKTLKEKVVQSAEAVKRKVKLIRNMKTSNNMLLESMLKPLTDPLNQMVESNHNNDNNNHHHISNNHITSDFDDEIKWKNNKKINSPKDENDYSERINYTSVQQPSEPSSSIEKNSDEISNASDNSYNDSDDDDNDNNNSFKTTESYSPSHNDPIYRKHFEIFEDIPFGVRMVNDKLMLGSNIVSITDKILKVKGTTYNLTPGLYNLLFMKQPDLNIITEDDKRNYKILLLETNAHRRDFNPNKAIKSNKGKKYMNIIKPLFQLSRSNEPTYGHGLPTMKNVGSDVSYVYWDDPNELVERLKLLIASRDAGNTGLDNEIIAIIEELREAGFVNSNI